MIKRLTWVMSLASVSLMGPYLDEMMLNKYIKIQNENVDFLNDTFHLKFDDLNKDLKKLSKNVSTFFIKNESAYIFGQVVNDLLKRNHINALKMNRDMLNCIQAESGDETKINPLKDDYKKVLMLYKAFWNRNSFYAFNLANAIALLRIGAMKGFFSQQYIEDKLLEIGDIIEANYLDYETFGLHVRMTTHLLSVSSEESSRYLVQAAFKIDSLWLSKECIWKHIPWTGHLKR